MATRPGWNNNKGRIPPNGMKFNKNAIEMKPSYRNDSYRELYELLNTNITYKEGKGNTYLEEAQCSICNREPVRDIIYPINMTTKIYF